MMQCGMKNIGGLTKITALWKLCLVIPDKFVFVLCFFLLTAFQ